jgi:hypothetical protein
VFLLSAYVHSARGVLMALRPQAHIQYVESLSGIMSGNLESSAT